MHTYIKYGEIYVVGFEYQQNAADNFRAIKEFDSEVKAASYVSYLNGGGWLSEDDDDDNGDDI